MKQDYKVEIVLKVLIKDVENEDDAVEYIAEKGLDSNDDQDFTATAEKDICKYPSTEI